MGNRGRLPQVSDINIFFQFLSFTFVPDVNIYVNFQLLLLSQWQNMQNL